MDFDRLILLTGMGGDSRLTRPVRVPGIRIITPDHIEPEDGEDLARYAARIAAIRQPRSYSLLQKLNGFIPDAALRLRTWGPFMRWRFAPITPEGRACLSAMADICPLGCAEPGLVLKDAGHSFTLTHAEQTSAAVASFLKG